jgi:hypothetical protein
LNYGETEVMSSAGGTMVHGGSRAEERDVLRPASAFKGKDDEWERASSCFATVLASWTWHGLLLDVAGRTAAASSSVALQSCSAQLIPLHIYGFSF